MEFCTKSKEETAKEPKVIMDSSYKFYVFKDPFNVYSENANDFTYSTVEHCGAYYQLGEQTVSVETIVNLWQQIYELQMSSEEIKQVLEETIAI